MKKFSRMASTLMLVAVVIFAAGCKKPEDTTNEGNEGGDDPNPTVLAEEGMYLGILGFNEVLTEKQISLLNTSTKSTFISFINNLNMADGTALYYADYTALNELQSFYEPAALKKVALVTFTDGLDNLSTSSSMMNPENYGSLSDYRTALHNKILNEKVHGKPITAYTIGLRGNDVQNNLTEFRANLNMLASDVNNVFEVTDMTEALERFHAIAEDLYYAVTTINLKLKLPGGFDEGLVLRFTFDDVNDVESSQEYIECIYKRTSNNGRRLESVSYQGFMQGASALDAVSQTETGTFHWFEFEGLTHLNGDVISQYDINHIQLWKKQGSVWQRDSEFTPGSSTEVTETKSSALIMLVLDCTSSLGDDFSMMKTGAIRFVESLCSSGGGEDPTNNYTISVSASPTNGGSVSGGGTYQQGQGCVVSATANSGFVFVNWTVNGNEVSSDANYSFTVNGNRSLVANFIQQTAENYTIAVSANPTGSGTVTGGGTYQQGQSCTVSATANNGYSFTNWTEGGNVVSTDASYSFTVTGNRTLAANFTAQYTISVLANPTESGTVTGGGTFSQGQNCTVSATANNGYSFTNWTEGGNVVSTDASYGFTVTGNRNLVANFTAIPQYTVSVSAHPVEGGTVTGGGTYQEGQTCTVRAIVNNGYRLANWTEDGIEVATGFNYAFPVTNDRNLVANFTYIGSGNAPTGAINAIFSVSPSQQVYFSQGNLQYQASTGTWRFAENQYDYVGEETYGNVYENGVKCDNSNISSTYSGWIDLFGWGTSGWNCGNTNYHPWDYTSDGSHYGSYGPPGNYDLTGNYSHSDWGVHNAISNGGNMAGQWRTLTQTEWNYIFNERHTSSGILFAKAQMEDVNGVILLPDDWDNLYYSFNDPNQDEVSFSSNAISFSTWMNLLQSHGAVFLPAAGIRSHDNVNHASETGYYWSSSNSSSSLYTQAYYIRWTNTKIFIYDTTRSKGLSVRLVCPVE